MSRRITSYADAYEHPDEVPFTAAAMGIGGDLEFSISKPVLMDNPMPFAVFAQPLVDSWSFGAEAAMDVQATVRLRRVQLAEISGQYYWQIPGGAGTIRPNTTHS